MDVRSVLAERVKHSRMRLNLNQTELAERSGIPYQVISRIEHGHQSIYVERLVELATILNVSLDYLVGRSDDPQPHARRPRRRTAAPVA